MRSTVKWRALIRSGSALKVILSRQKDYAWAVFFVHQTLGPFPWYGYAIAGLGWVSWALFDFFKIMPEEVQIVWGEMHRRLERMERKLDGRD